MKCPCGVEFVQRRATQRFHDRDCQRRHNNASSGRRQKVRKRSARESMEKAREAVERAVRRAGGNPYDHGVHKAKRRLRLLVIKAKWAALKRRRKNEAVPQP